MSDEELNLDEVSLEGTLEDQARVRTQDAVLEEVDPSEEGFSYPVEDVLGEPVDSMPVVPAGANEFICAACFLVHNKTVLADPGAGVCRDCA